MDFSKYFFFLSPRSSPTYCNKTSRYSSIRRKTAWDLHQKTHTQTDFRVAASSARSQAAFKASSSVVRHNSQAVLTSASSACVRGGSVCTVHSREPNICSCNDKIFVFSFLDGGLWSELRCLILFLMYKQASILNY